MFYSSKFASGKKLHFFPYWYKNLLFVNTHQLFSTFLFKLLSSERIELVMKSTLQYRFPELHF